MKGGLALKMAIGMVMTIVIADVIIDALTPTKSLAFNYRLTANIGIVVISAVIYWWKKGQRVSVWLRRKNLCVCLIERIS